MSNDLLFSVLPRQGTVPIAHDEHKVQKVSKEAALRALNDEEQELHLEEREAREKQQQSQSKNKSQVPAKEEEASEDNQQIKDKDKSDKGFKHLDIYV
ncbi:hypothetical protein [Paraglaciecola hydrolytica]|uniref:Uncharacterized protein n=1 Tax=Paraglaciecola hydrolytica TaxID=1799789 RepID=A0A148KM78_9ALTE|nr:hypothetical protein [Paraglaciecola hydrolytica]KXI27412.1 hypothetical protein AX660_22100 [Paraglaciecola hydrolytica]